MKYVSMVMGFCLYANSQMNKTCMKPKRYELNKNYKKNENRSNDIQRDSRKKKRESYYEI